MHPWAHLAQRDRPRHHPSHEGSRTGGTPRHPPCPAGLDGPDRPESQAEARLIRRLEDWGFPAPERQFEIRSPAGVLVGRVDVAWPQQRVGLEYDGSATHGPRRIEADQARHDRIEKLGWTLLHADRLDLRPGDTRLPTALREVFRQRRAA